MESYFLGSADRRLLLSYHAPTTVETRGLVIICPPMFRDYLRTQLALRELAIALAEHQHHVIRFDYRGTGDSFGQLSQVQWSEWEEDVFAVMQEGNELTGLDEVSLVGIRLGAGLACSVAASSEKVRRVVVWDPITDGASYIEHLRRLQKKRFEYNNYLPRSERRIAANEIAGQKLSPDMLKHIESIDSNLYLAVCERLISVVSADEHAIDPLPSEVIRFDCNWGGGSDDLMMPRPVLERLVHCLTN